MQRIFDIFKILSIWKYLWTQNYTANCEVLVHEYFAWTEGSLKTDCVFVYMFFCVCNISQLIENCDSVPWMAGWGSGELGIRFNRGRFTTSFTNFNRLSSKTKTATHCERANCIVVEICCPEFHSNWLVGIAPRPAIGILGYWRILRL